MDPEQEQSDLGPCCLPLRLLKHFSRREKQTTFVAIGALRVNHVPEPAGDMNTCMLGFLNFLSLSLHVGGDPKCKFLNKIAFLIANTCTTVFTEKIHILEIKIVILHSTIIILMIENFVLAIKIYPLI